MLTQKHRILDFNATDLLYIFIEVQKCFAIIKIVKKLSWKGTGLSKGEKIACLDNIRQNN